MGSDQLDEQRELERDQAIASELGISHDDFQELNPVVMGDEDNPNILLIEFSKDSPKKLLRKVKGLGVGSYSLRIDWFDDCHSGDWDDWNSFDHDEEAEAFENKISPYLIFNTTFSGLKDIFNECDDVPWGENSRNSKIKLRMVFAQLISALEVYLGDTLRNYVNENQQSIFTLISQNKVLTDSKFSLLEIFNNPKLVQNKVQEHLQNILYHNLFSVHWHYKKILNIDIWPNEEIREKLLEAVRYRHDCVHRDGKDKNGEPIIELQSKKYVNEILDIVNQFVKRIHEELIGEFDTNFSKLKLKE